MIQILLRLKDTSICWRSVLVASLNNSIYTHEVAAEIHLVDVQKLQSVLYRFFQVNG